jgi:hypothetical protein
VERLPRRGESDFPITRDTGAHLVDQIIRVLQTSTAAARPAVASTESLDGHQLLHRAILRAGQRAGLAFAARDLLVLTETSDIMIGTTGESYVAAERSARLEAESARARAGEAEARSEAVAQRQRFLAEASRLLAESMDYAATLRTVRAWPCPVSRIGVSSTRPGRRAHGACSD